MVISLIMNLARNYFTIFLLLLIYFFVSDSPVDAKCLPTPVIEVPQPKSAAIKGYLQQLHQINKNYCTRKAGSEFEKLSHKYKSIVTYVPELADGRIDLETLKNGMPELENKWNWLNQTLLRLKEQKGWSSQRHQSVGIRRVVQYTKSSKLTAGNLAAPSRS